MDRIGLVLFPDQWTGKEYLDHWRLGLKSWPPTKQRGMATVRELLTLAWDGTVIVEAETDDGAYEQLEAQEIRYFHGGHSLVGDAFEHYRACRLRFPLTLQTPSTSQGGRSGYNWPSIVVQILAYLGEHGTQQTADEITNTIIADLEKGKDKPPAYSTLQRYVSALMAYHSTASQKFPNSNSGINGCDSRASPR